MNWLTEIDSGDEAFDPADFGLEGLQTIELDPQLLVHLGTLDKLHSAAVERGVIYPHAIVQLARSAETDKRIERDAFAPACA